MFSDDRFLALFLAALQERPAKYDLRVPLLDPAVGAAIYAAKHSDRALSPSALHNSPPLQHDSSEVNTS